MLILVLHPELCWNIFLFLVSSSAFAIITYWWLAPTALYFLLRWRFQSSESIEFSFLELLSVYGYSLTIFIPTSFLWMINISSVQWILVLVAVALSGSVLFSTFWPTLNKDSNKQVNTCLMRLQTFVPRKIGFWVWILGWVLYPKPKHKTQYFLYQNPKTKPKNCNTQTQNLKIFIANPKFFWIQTCVGLWFYLIAFDKRTFDFRLLSELPDWFFPFTFCSD